MQRSPVTHQGFYTPLRVSPYRPTKPRPMEVAFVQAVQSSTCSWSCCEGRLRSDGLPRDCPAAGPGSQGLPGVCGKLLFCVMPKRAGGLWGLSLSSAGRHHSGEGPGALQKSVGGGICFLSSDPVPFSLLQWLRRWWLSGRSTSSPSAPASPCPTHPATHLFPQPPFLLSTSTRWGMGTGKAKDLLCSPHPQLSTQELSLSLVLLLWAGSLEEQEWCHPGASSTAQRSVGCPIPGSV